ncbi:hypothetical protein Acsp06_60840 [Actinomycetospora sp. NBRC 106375]|uniref:DUF6286 domain-containing protein n=1 Tax=Actinomycetospora sp. NBRC 106375 TaxID=3032207 RepID=UPI0024A3E2C2|nr:DUF6286 domain-containing protein [Actinomycetospora sp. NBRC 106375]GLZ49899.1 hypothetical protein Acsp06_60840 [Actinomycetospora sp. NBRC 106375]
MRLLLRVLAPLLGLLLAVVGLAVVVETVTAWVAPTSSPLVVPWTSWRTTIEGLTWQSGAVRTVAIVVGVVALFVLLLGLTARRHDVFLADPVPEVTVTTSPRSLARAVGHEVRSHDEVVSASVVASAKRVTVKAATLDPAGEVRTAVKDRVEEMLVRLPLARRPRVAVSVTTTKGVK